MKQHTVIKNSLITAGILGAATGFCFLIQEAAESDTHVPLLFCPGSSFYFQVHRRIYLWDRGVHDRGGGRQLCVHLSVFCH